MISDTLDKDILLEYRKNKREQLFIALFILLLGLYFNIWVSLSLFALGILLILIFTKKSSFNGYKLDDNRLTLFYDTFIQQYKEEIYLHDLKSINYYYLGGGNCYIIYAVGSEEFISDTFNNIYSFAKVLKYLKYEKGINVLCKGRVDAEIKLYLDNKIDKLPMENK
ncbi:hypothetical protein DNU06_17390 [Putridiphycobacter roseus]|uniref:Uncharacterized protein n=1 Tax=Putridiphycobacter roseus TaxID=2219161 RepID=A0A2W1MWP4_9FLAO|nr:hypothetical protein [Putridiphycobacter roseus]PZE15570.1 hypothetical protein DNU06_17390 [Putridiphycobacter roseus]